LTGVRSSSSSGGGSVDGQQQQQQAGRSAETQIKEVLTRALSPTSLEVRDTSGGCGAMFSIAVVSPKFAGKSLVAQHRLVTDAIRKEIAAMHGLTITTKAS